VSIKSHIIDPKTGKAAFVDATANEQQALVVATRPLKIFTTKTVYAINDTYGREMAQDGKYSGTPVLITDGTDTGAWNFSEPVGLKWSEGSTDHFHSGAKSDKCDNSLVGGIVQYINNAGPGTDIDMSGYVALTLWIYVSSDWVAGDSFTLYAYVDGGLVGNTIKLEDYFDFDRYNIWQFIDIPLADLGIETSLIDAFRIECSARSGAKSPLFYIDDFNIQETGAPIDFEIAPDEGTWLHVKSFQTTFVDVGAFTDAARPPYDQILSMAATTGYLYRRYAENKSDPIFEVRITNLMDLLGLPNTKISNYLPDGTNTLMTIENIYPADEVFIMKSENLDRLVFTIEDDFSQLLFFRISVQGFVEQR